jgi:hypothetical protein
MLALLGGVALLLGLLLLIYLFVSANPATLARALKWTGLGIGLVLFGYLLLSERFAFLWIPLLTVGVPYLRRLRSVFDGFFGTAPGSRSSEVVTPYLRMTLDHESGTMAGTVLAGRFEGMRLAELGVVDLVALLRECRSADADGARLLEAYLDRLHPDWRDRMGDNEQSSPPPGARTSGDMTTQEAYEILGLEPGADEAAIRAAHHRLMMQLHPDHGGTDYLATKINRARDVLLKH